MLISTKSLLNNATVIFRSLECLKKLSESGISLLLKFKLTISHRSYRSDEKYRPMSCPDASVATRNSKYNCSQTNRVRGHDAK